MWDTCDFQEEPSLPTSFPTQIPHFSLSCLTICLLHLLLAYLFFHPSGLAGRQDLFKRFLSSKTDHTGEMHVD